MSFREISAWLALIILGYVFADYAAPLVRERTLEAGGGDAMISLVIGFVVLMVLAQILVGVIRRNSKEEEDERDHAIEAKSERIGGFALGAVAFAGLFYALQRGDIAYANILFLGLVVSEIVKRIWQVALYRMSS